MNEYSDFDEFFKHDFAQLVGFLCKAGFDLETAKDAAADAMVQAFERWSSLDHPRAWVRKAAPRIARAQLQRTEEGVRRAVKGDWSQPLDRETERLISFLEETAWVASLVNQLPTRQRDVIVWALDGFSPTQIADHLGLSTVTVRSNLRHARKRLERLYGQQRPAQDLTEGGNSD
ncbi:RNA polymerase sigma factor [Amycolatopsis japonica]|uniref:RNA polymerase sigma factor n=1 Tax=Amycolatopsis TaxID=1813 RepID=UPI0033E3BA7B